MMDLIPRDPSGNPAYPHQSMPELMLPPQPSAPASDGGILLRLRRRKLLFASVFLLVLGLVTAAYLYLPPTYRAEASITVSPPERILASQQGVDAAQTIGDTSDLESQAVILSSPLLIRELLKNPAMQADLRTECEVSRPPAWKAQVKDLLGMKPTPSCDVLLADTTGMVSNLKERLGVATNGRSRVINVAATSPLPEVAQAIANGIVQAYLDARIREKLEPRDEAIEWLRGEGQRVSARLKSTEQQIEAFLHSKGVVRGQVGPIASEQLTSLAQQLSLAEADKAAAAGRLQQANAQGGATTGVLDNRGVSDIKQQLALVNSQMAQMSARYGASNPALVELQQQRRSLESSLGRETGLVTRSAQADYNAANSRVTTLRSQLDSLKQDVRGNDDATTQVASLQRDATTDRELLVDLTKNLNQLETNRRLATANARLVSLAELPQSVFFPKVTTFALTGLLLATAFAVVATLLRDRADPTIRAIDGLEDASRLRVLARVPHVSRVGRTSGQLDKKMSQPSAFQEAIRGLYAECLLLRSQRRRERPLRSVMVCSASKGEGKSFITLSLAHFAAAAGQRVLILECDLRRPSIGRSLRLPAVVGVSDVLRGTTLPEEAVVRAASDRLDVIVAGRPTMDSAELLGGPEMRKLLDWAFGRYDLVLIDTPPSRSVADTRILAPEVDGILYRAQWGHSHTESVVEGVSEVRAAGGNVLGLVLDRVEPDHYRLYDTSNPADLYLVSERS